MAYRSLSAGNRARPVWVALVAVAVVFGCSYYSPDLLSGTVGGGSGSPAVGGASGSMSSSGSSSSGEGPIADPGGAGGMGAGSGGSGGSSGSLGSSGSSGSSSHPVGGAGGDVGEGGAGGEGGAPDVDACPDDPDKLQPGRCGCGVAESCADLEAALAHRYDFARNGALAADKIGDADATIVGASAAQGKVTFDGTTNAYVDLPNGMISALSDASFEIWLQWGGGAVWQRIFDFGISDKGEGNQGYYPPTYLYLTPSDGQTGNGLRASFSSNGINNETVVRTSKPLATGSLQHIVLVVDDTNDELRLYLNGAVSAMNGFSGKLSSLNDVNNWIGRSNFVDDPLNGTIEEFRVYDVALSSSLVRASYEFGPNPTFL